MGTLGRSVTVFTPFCAADTQCNNKAMQNHKYCKEVGRSFIDQHDLEARAELCMIVPIDEERRHKLSTSKSTKTILSRIMA